MNKLFYLMVFCIVQNVYSNNLYKNLVREYAVDPPMRAILDEHHKELLAQFNVCQPGICVKKRRVYEFPWLPGYLVKSNPNRVLGMKRARTCIKKYKLNLLSVLDKRLYETNGRIFVIVPKINCNVSSKPLNLRQVKQMWTFILKSNYTDLHRFNYCKQENEKIIIIDTELHSFQENEYFKGFSHLLVYHYPSHYEEDAFRFLLENFVHFIPDNIHPKPGLSKEKRRFSYPQIYRRIYKNLTKRKNIFEWDYLAFFKEKFPDPDLS